ncbi:MAG: hypothetical protein NTZ30_14520 [Planctomycetota bacterium]|nr:hypothetical protein [Planctomycetota bacterium]
MIKIRLVSAKEVKIVGVLAVMIRPVWSFNAGIMRYTGFGRNMP